VTFDGGHCPAEGAIYFVPTRAADAKETTALIRPGSGRFSADGLFVASSFREGDGLLPGVYDVRIACVAPLSTHDASDSQSFVPEGFTPPSLEVKTGGPRSMRYDLDVPAAKSRP